MTNLINMFPSGDKLRLAPISQEAELLSAEEYLARSSPHDRRRSAECNQLVQLLQGWSQYCIEIRACILTTTERCKHFSINTKSSSVMGVCNAMIDGR